METKPTVRYIPEEDESDTRMVKALGRLNLVQEPQQDADPFNKAASVLKAYSGTDSNFKRKVTNQLNKVLSNSDGTASSQRIEEGFTGYDAFAVISPPYNLDYLAKLYEVSAIHHASVEAKISNIVGLGYQFIPTNATTRLLEEQASNDKKATKTRKALDVHKDELILTFESFSEEDTFTETLSKVWRDYETTGNGYLEIGRKINGEIGYVGHIPAQTMRVRRDRDGFIQLSGNKVQFFAPFGAGRDKTTGERILVNNPVGNGTPNEVIHIKNHSPVSTYYGIPDIIAAQQAVAGNEFASRFNLDYFEHKAIPRHLIILKGAKLGTQAQSHLLEFFETNLKGQNHRSLFIPLPGDVDGGEKVEFSIEPIEAGVQDASFTKFRGSNDDDIFAVHRVPRTKVMVTAGINIAVAQDADKTFKEQVCGPLQRVFEKKLNRIVKEFTDAFEIQFSEMTLTDEDTQSKIDERRIKTGTETPNEQRAARGKPTHPDGNKLFDLNSTTAQARAEATTNRNRDAARSANGTDSNGTTRNAQGQGRAQG